MRNLLKKVLILSALIICAALVRPVARAQTPESLDFQTSGGVQHFQVEVARSVPDRERGLMFRRYMPEDRGMLFQFDRAETVYFWMKNTFIPLDMIFVGPDNKVVSIARDAEPMSEKIISSGAPTTSVVEINGGLAAKLGIAAGDTMIFPAPAR